MSRCASRRGTVRIQVEIRTAKGTSVECPIPGLSEWFNEHISISRRVRRVDMCNVEVQDEAKIYRSATRTRTPSLRAIGSKIELMYLEPNMPGINSIVGVLLLSAGSGLKPTSA